VTQKYACYTDNILTAVILIYAAITAMAAQSTVGLEPETCASEASTLTFFNLPLKRRGQKLFVNKNILYAGD